MAHTVTYLLALAMALGVCLGGRSDRFLAEIVELKRETSKQMDDVENLEQTLQLLIQRLDKRNVDKVTAVDSGEQEEKTDMPGPSKSPKLSGKRGGRKRNSQAGRNSKGDKKIAAAEEGTHIVCDDGPKVFLGGNALYTRWGRSNCGPKSSLVYHGFVSKSMFGHNGGGVNYLCMANEPEHNQRGASSIEDGLLAGVQFNTKDQGVFENEVSQTIAPCAVCLTRDRPALVMIPGKRSCTKSYWHKEYEGYLMSSRYSDNSTSSYECVDSRPTNTMYNLDENQYGNTAGFNFNRPLCGAGVPCKEDSYSAKKVIACVVCSM